MKTILKNLFFVLLLVLTSNCNNKQQGNIDENGNKDIRIIDNEKPTARDNTYPDNAVGEYLNYIDANRSAEYPTPKKSIELLAAAIVEKNNEANIKSGGDLQNLAALDYSEDYEVKKADFTTILKALEKGFERGDFEGGEDLEGLKENTEKMKIEDDQTKLSKEMQDFLETAAEILQKMKVRGNDEF